jgi:hypothetical protein
VLKGLPAIATILTVILLSIRVMIAWRDWKRQ